MRIFLSLFQPHFWHRPPGRGQIMGDFLSLITWYFLCVRKLFSCSWFFTWWDEPKFYSWKVRMISSPARLQCSWLQRSSGFNQRIGKCWAAKRFLHFTRWLSSPFCGCLVFPWCQEEPPSDHWFRPWEAQVAGQAEYEGDRMAVLVTRWRGKKCVARCVRYVCPCDCSVIGDFSREGFL